MDSVPVYVAVVSEMKCLCVCVGGWGVRYSISDRRYATGLRCIFVCVCVCVCV